MSREYRRIELYEEEILRMRATGYTRREIREKYGFKMKQLVNFITRYNRKQEKIAAGVALRKKGRPSKDYVVSEESKIAELKYIIARKDAKIKALQMENELMRDFLLLTGKE
jgi:hypothetical protein